MTTAFQPGAFQSDGYQIEGGLTTTDVIVGINVTQEGDSCGLTVNLAQTDVTGGWPTYIPRRRRKVVEQPEPVVEEVVQTAEEISAKIATKIALDRARRKDAAVVAELKALYAEQDRLKETVAVLETSLQEQENEELALILALAG